MVWNLAVALTVSYSFICEASSSMMCSAGNTRTCLLDAIPAVARIMRAFWTKYSNAASQHWLNFQSKIWFSSSRGLVAAQYLSCFLACDILSRTTLSSSTI